MNGRCLACKGAAHESADAECSALHRPATAAEWPRWYALEERAAIIEYDAGFHRETAQIRAKAELNLLGKRRRG